MSGDEDYKGQYRWDPFLKEWIIYAPNRNKRPFQGKKFEKEQEKKTWTCPFCPDAPEGAGDWIVKLLPNKYAALSEEAFPFDPKPTTGFSMASPNAGRCNVVLYSQDHNASFGTLSLENIEALIKLWGDTFREIASDKRFKYIFIMENRGKEIGTSMSHPHGQIYSFPIIPKKIEREFESFRESYDKSTNTCLMCKVVKEESENPVRIIEENEHFIAEIPYYAHWPFEVHIMAKEHISTIADLDEKQITSLALIMKKVVQRYDKLWKMGGGQSPFMPYIMAMHNAPVNTENAYTWHFHIEYYTPFRGPEKWKYLAGVELGTNTFIADNLPRINAKTMRDLEID